MTTDAKIQKVFSKELDKITTIIIGQRISSIQQADRIIVMHEGQIESIGFRLYIKKSTNHKKEGWLENESRGQSSSTSPKKYESYFDKII